jgi:hypothetical protein
MTEIAETSHNEHIDILLSTENEQNEVFSTEPLITTETEETLNFLNECNMSMFNFTKDTNNNVILKPIKIKLFKKKYNLYQYNLTTNNYQYIDKFCTLQDISKYLEKLGISINLKTLIKKLFKIELN